MGGNALKNLLPLALICLTGCSYFDKEPVAKEPPGTEKCDDACLHLKELGCQGWEDVAECTTFCETTQENGHRLDPDFVLAATDCTEFSPDQGVEYLDSSGTADSAIDAAVDSSVDGVLGDR